MFIVIRYSPFYQHYVYDRVYGEDGHFNWYNLNFFSINGVDEHLILLSVFFPLTDRTREDLKEIKNKIENINENLKTLMASPTREEGQFPQTVAGCLRLVLLIDQWLFVYITLGPHKNNSASINEFPQKIPQCCNLSICLCSFSQRVIWEITYLELDGNAVGCL